jgi:uncharacterized cofD-like protein
MPGVRVIGTMKKLVRIGGGSSGYTLLRGLKALPVELTAVVNMFDSGGSTGVLRDELGILPPGDIRRALAALAEGERGEILRNLFNYRFKEGGSVSGHSFGNLFLAALSEIYGSDIEAIRKGSELLGLTGTVLPVSLDQSHIHAQLEDGTEIVGETNLDIPKHDGSIRITQLTLEPKAHIFSEADKAIREADIIVIGPGDLYTSIIPNLLVEGMSEALRASSGVTVVICNLMTKWGETHGFVASDMLRELLAYSGLEKFDYAFCNTSPLDESLVAAYAKEKKYPMRCDEDLQTYAAHVITGDFFSEADIARHDADKVARAISTL